MTENAPPNLDAAAMRTLAATRFEPFVSSSLGSAPSDDAWLRQLQFVRAAWETLRSADTELAAKLRAEGVTADDLIGFARQLDSARKQLAAVLEVIETAELRATIIAVRLGLEAAESK
jgi:hypothetical protein